MESTGPSSTGAAGAAGLLKTVYALRDQVLPPTVNFGKPNPNIDFDALPFYVNTELQPWQANGHDVRTAGVSSFGFGGTNFHVVVQEHVPGMLTRSRRTFAVAGAGNGTERGNTNMPKAPYRGSLLLGASSVFGLQARLQVALTDAACARGKLVHRGRDRPADRLRQQHPCQHGDQSGQAEQVATFIEKGVDVGAAHGHLQSTDRLVATLEWG